MEEQIYKGMLSYVDGLRNKLKVTTDEKLLNMYHNMYMDGFDRIQTIHHSEMEAYDKQQRRELEERRINVEAELERLKAKFDWKKAGLEMSKIIIPLAVNTGVIVLGLQVTHDVETTGRINTKLGNTTIGWLPKPFR